MRAKTAFVALIVTVLALAAAGSAQAAAPVCSTASPLTAVSDHPVRLYLSCSDADGDALTYSVASEPSHGRLSPHETPGPISYLPDASYAGPDSFVLRASDGTAGPAAEVSFAVMVQPMVAPAGCLGTMIYPVRKDGLRVLELGLCGGMLGYAGIPNSVLVTEGPSHGRLTGPDQAPLYIPDDGWVGTDTVKIKARNAVGESPEQTVQLNVTDGGDIAPTCTGAAPSSSVRNTGAPVTMRLSCSDVDLEPATMSIVTGPQHGSLSAITTAPYAPITTSLMPTINPTNATVQYTPEPGYTGPDSFTFRGSDGRLDSTPSSVSLSVVADGPANAAPTCFAGDALVPRNAGGGIYPGCTDSEGDALTYSMLQPPSHGTLSGTLGSGAMRYKPEAGYLGGDTFTYRAQDARGAQSPPVTVTISVVDPWFVPPITAVACGARVINATRNQTVVTGPLSCSASTGETGGLTVTSPPAHGTVSVEADGRMTYAPDVNYVGPDLFTVETNVAGFRLPYPMAVAVGSNAKAKIRSGPPSHSQSTSQTFTFAAEPGVTLTCALSNSTHADLTPCSDSVSYSDTPAGDHVFSVRATDGAGRVTTDTYLFTVEGSPATGGGGTGAGGGGAVGGGGGATPTAQAPASPAPAGSEAPSPPASPAPAPGPAPAPPVTSPYEQPASTSTAASPARALRNALARQPSTVRALRRGGASIAVEAPGPGRLTIRWYAQTKGGRMLLAAGTTRVNAPRSTKVHVTLTGAGRRLLRSTRGRITVIATATYTRSAQHPVSRSRRFTLPT